MKTRLTSRKARYTSLISKDWVRVGAAFLAWRIAVSALFAISVVKVHQIANPELNPPVHANLLLQGTVKWDGYHYLHLVTQGWGAPIKTGFPAFYPLFPLLVRGLADLTHLNPVNAAFIINFIASYFACFFLYGLAKDFFKDHGDAMRTTLLFMFFPMAYFMFAFYTEAVFCALSFGAFYFARKRRWLICVLFLAAVSAVRLPGLVVALAVFVEYLSSLEWNWRKLDRNFFLFALAPAGFLGYMYYLWKAFGDPLMFRNAYNYGWGYQKLNLNFFHTILGATHGFIMAFIHRHAGSAEGGTNMGYEVISWYGALGLIITRWKKLPASYIVLCLASLVLFILNSNVVSVNRYVLPLFPIYLIIYSWLKEHATAYALTLGCFAVTMGLYLTLFSNGYWTG
jgi:hypothetical protein